MRGHADDMISRLKNNAVLQRRYRERHQRMYDALTNEFTNHHLNNPDISKEQRDAIKAKIRKTIKRERRSAMIKTVSITAVITIVIILLFLQNTYGQGIVSEENRWNVLGMGFPGSMGTETYSIDGDSVIDNYTYKMIWMTFDSIDASWMYQGLLREDSNIVYYVPSDASEGVLYDFNLEVGDTAYIKNMFCYDTEVQVVIENIDTAEYLGISRRRWHLAEDYGFPEFWIEGIGSNLGPLHTKYVMCIVCPTWELLCFHQNENLLYSLSPSNDCYIVNISEFDSQPNIEIFPNPAREKFEVRSAEFGVDLIEIFDMSGRKVLEQQFPASTREFEVDISKLMSGSYLCCFTSNEKKITRKILIR